jgi:hypothetical protein
MPDKRRYWGTGAQLKDEELLPAATAEQVAFHVASEPLATILDSTFSSGMHPVCPALIMRSWSCAIGELSDVQPAAPGSTTASGGTRRRCGAWSLPGQRLRVAPHTFTKPHQRRMAQHAQGTPTTQYHGRPRRGSGRTGVTLSKGTRSELAFPFTTISLEA